MGSRGDAHPCLVDRHRIAQSVAFRRGPDIGLNRFIFRRDAGRWLAHGSIMWGCIIVGAVTFPLVFGWIHFESLSGDIGGYRIFLFGFPAFAFNVHSFFAFAIFHGLVWSSFLVIAGVMLAMCRRMRERGVGFHASIRE